MLSSSLEKYLVCIYKHLESSNELKVSELAREMNQPLQKTIQALQRMHYQKQIVYSTYQPLKITDQGKKMAQYLIARDALIEEFFAILHMDENAEAEKEAMAQYLSHDSLTKIERFILFNRKYPEIAERFELLLQLDLEETLLPPLGMNDK
ncbi:MAG: hypothetical protein E7231_00120 [Cellulosilyticum sp.]|nr:hypothetical protein [Cellulosilyticum sp.]